MAEAMVSAATGVVSSAASSLTTLLVSEYKLAGDVRRGVRFMRDELSSMNAAFQRLAEVGDDRIDAQTKEWRSKVRELSYDIQDCADRFRLLHSSDEAKLNFVRRMARKVRRLWVEDPEISREIRELKARVMEEKERRDRYDIGLSLSTTTQPAPPGPGLDPRALAFYEEARDLVGIDGPRDQIIGWLGSEEEQLKVVSIFGVRSGEDDPCHGGVPQSSRTL
jgi:hypothetical protein